jgi:GNAT superfamily N-acetyltransferase
MREEPKIRLGTPEDADAMLDLALRAWEENGIKGVNPEKMLGMIKPALYLWQGLVGIIGEPRGKIEGAVLLRTSQMWYSDEWMLEEKAIFVDPEFRSAKGGRARKLCEFSKKVADDLGIPLIIGVLSNHRTEAKVRLYERQFGPPAGAFFLYNVQTGHEEHMTEH